jgi:hypothetical protein
MLRRAIAGATAVTWNLGDLLDQANEVAEIVVTRHPRRRRTLSPMAMARIGRAGGAINGVIYAAGGTSRGASGTYHEAYTP